MERLFRGKNQAAGHQGRFNHLRNSGARNACRVLIFGDSYAFDTHKTSWFALQCHDVFCLWQTAMQQALVDQLSSDIVISEVAEPFATRLPTDDLPG